MSKAFLKDDAQDEGILVAARAPLPPGVPNLVTARGLELLEKEYQGLLSERTRLQTGTGNDLERARELTALQERLDALTDRLNSAQLVSDKTPGTIGFGATVTTRALSGKFKGEEQRFRLVGVDEAAADESNSSVAFLAPIARALEGHNVGEQVKMQTSRGSQVLEVVAVTYE